MILKITDKIYNYRYYLLLLTLVVYFFTPTVNISALISIIVKLFTISILLLSGANFIQKDKKFLRTTWFVFGFVIICLAFLFNFFPGNVLMFIIQYLLMLIFFLVILISLLQQFFNVSEVTLDVIIGSFCGYLLIGISSFFLYMIIDIIDPESFSGLSGELDEKVAQLFYFAFTTMTTIGFGDILPIKLTSQKLAVLTAAVGQFYIAVVVAILVSRYMRRSDKL